MADPAEKPEETKSSFTIPAPVITGIVFAVLVGAAYIFFGPNAAKAVCSAIM